MRVVIMAGRSFSSRERVLLQRLEVGLADEGVRVVHAIPSDSPLATETEVFTQVVMYESHGLPWTRGIRSRHLVERLDALPRAADERVADVVHSFDDAWPFAVEVARQTGAALAVDFWCASMTRRAGTIRAAAHDLAGLVMLTPDPTLERMVRQEVEDVSVRHTPWGVHCPSESRSILAPERAPAVVVSGAGSDRAALGAAVEGLARVAAGHDDLMVFCDAHAARRADIWPLVRKLGLESRFSLTPLLEGRRELALRADLLVIPEALGEFRSLTIDAMASGLAVVSAEDPVLGYLQDGRTAHLIAQADPSTWAQAIASLLDDPARARALGASAREFVRTEHRVSVHIATVIDAYEWMTAGDAMRIREAGR